MDVVLEPGDVLYVPRGCIHATATPEGDLPSMHMTVGMETMWDVGEWKRGGGMGTEKDAVNHTALDCLGVAMTWEAFLGAGDVSHHNHIMEGYYTALAHKIDSDVR